MEKLIVSAAILLAVGSAIGCAGDTDEDPNQDEVQQALDNGYGSNRGGPNTDVQNGAAAKGEPATHQPRQSQTQFDDPTQHVEGR